MSAKPITLVVLLISTAGPSVLAHDLPISGLQIVADEREIHAELMLNSGELVFVRELDRNANDRLEVEEVGDQAESIAKRICQCLTIEVDGHKVEPETLGLVPDLTTHHLTVRAHYAVDARYRPLTVESRLWEITRGGHTTLVSFRTSAGNQEARLDARSRRVVFNAAQAKTNEAANFGTSPAVTTRAMIAGLCAGATIALLGYFVMRGFRKHSLNVGHR